MSRQSKNGLYPDLFRRALSQHYKLGLRSENHAHYSELFVDNDHLETLGSPDWQLILGRRGTGKTILLGALHERQRLNPDVLSVYVSMQDCLVSPVGRTVSDKLQALGYFQAFIEVVAKSIVDHVEIQLGEPSFFATLNGSHRRLRDRIEYTLLEILSLAQEGLPIGAFGEFESTKRKAHKRSRTKGGRIRAGARVSVKGPRVGIDAGFAAGTGQQTELAESQRMQTPAVPRFAHVRDKILELLGLIPATRLVILIDEWSTLDRTARRAVQPEFAELLKRTFAGTPHISVKIAAIPWQTRLNNRGGKAFRGLELNADIFENVNLDSTSHRPDDLWEFYTQLLYRRLAFCAPELRVFDAKGRGVPDPQFVASIFRNERAFTELIKGAGGVPRDFLTIFNHLSEANNFRVRPTWDAPRVHAALRHEGGSKQQEINLQSEADQLLTQCICPRVLAAGSLVFLVRRDDRIGYSTAIEELLERRLVHEYPKQDMAPELRGRYDPFIVDYGIYLDWKRSPVSGSTGQTAAYHPEPHPRIDALMAEELVIETGGVARNQIVCPSCNAVFDEDARPYKVRGLCPECFIGVDDQAAA